MIGYKLFAHLRVGSTCVRTTFRDAAKNRSKASYRFGHGLVLFASWMHRNASLLARPHLEYSESGPSPADYDTA